MNPIIDMEMRAGMWRAAYPKLCAPGHDAAKPYVVQEQGRDVIYARWVIGAAYGNASKLYGAFPRGFVPKAKAFFADIDDTKLLHAFSGSVPAGSYARLDMVKRFEGDVRGFVRGNVYEADKLLRLAHLERVTVHCPFELIIADPPYTAADSSRYGVPTLDRLRATEALAQVVADGGFMVWLDTQWPMHNKKRWVTVGRIALTRSTGHRIRDVTIFRRVPR